MSSASRSPCSFAVSAWRAESAKTRVGETCSASETDLHLAVDLGEHVAFGSQAVAQRVDLVEHDEAVAIQPVDGRQVLLPQLAVGARHAEVGGDHEDDGRGIGHPVHGELRLGAERAEAGRIEDHEPAREQRVGKVEHRVAPARDAHRPIALHGVAQVGRLRRIHLDRFRDRLARAGDGLAAGTDRAPPRSRNRSRRYARATPWGSRGSRSAAGGSRARAPDPRGSRSGKASCARRPKAAGARPGRRRTAR